ncbi:MAG: phosphate/phosphite/phosphonate ABC transporter substrate-binding protein [Pseudomonadota bacterium]
MSQNMNDGGSPGLASILIWSAASIVFFCLFLITDAERLSAAPENPRPLKVAILHCGDAVTSFEVFSPFVSYLTEKIGRRMQLVISEDIPSLERSLQDGEVDFVLQDSPLYIHLSSYYNRDHLLKVIGMDGKDTLTGLVIVRKDSPYHRISDLADKRVQFGPTTSGVKWVAGRKLFTESGILPGKNLKEYVGVSGCCDEIAFNVFFKKVDAGVICDHAFDKIIKKGDIKIGELRTIGLTATIPSAVFAAAGHVAPAIIAAVFDACLALDKNKPQYAQMLSDTDIGGFARTSDAAYDGIRGEGY